MSKALEIKIDGKLFGTFVPPEGSSFGVMMGNIFQTHMKVQVTTGTREEEWYWKLPDIAENQEITFRMVEAEPGSGIPPASVVPVEAEELADSSS